ncbi:MAG: hypothetical protein AB1502_08110 [Thermodesulfobacteriota bacterium]
MKDHKLEKILQAVTKAILSKPDLLTGDAINALVGGHGMLNIAGFCAANSIAEEILKGGSLKIEALNQPEIEMDRVLEAGINSAKQMGADPSNAALITAALCYVAGSNVRAGVPSGNRKLGAMARMKAGAQKGAVSIIPTPKSNNKLSGFPAVHEIYHQMMEGNLTQINGRDIPPGVPAVLCGHSTLGEDYIFPELAQNGARVGTQAMMRAYAGAGLRPNPFISAIFGVAAILEIVHPDSPAPERFGPSFQVFTHHLAGLSAVKASGMPDVLHFRVTGEKFETGKVIGDIGMILKDIGTPTVVGMLAFNEIFGCFEESGKIGTGGSGGPRTSPIGHLLADASLAIRTISLTKSIEKAADVIKKNKEKFIDSDIACIEANTVARKVEEYSKGPVSKALLIATEGQTREAIEFRIKETCKIFQKGGTLGEVIKLLENRRIRRIENGVSEIMSKNFGKSIEIKIGRIAGGARRSGNRAKKIWILDPDIDATVKIEGKKVIMESFCKTFIPKAVMGKKAEELEAITIAAPAVSELLFSGHTLIDLEVPASVSVLMGIHSSEDAAKEVTHFGAILSGGMPGCEEKVQKVCRLALDIYNHT